MQYVCVFSWVFMSAVWWCEVDRWQHISDHTQLCNTRRLRWTKHSRINERITFWYTWTGPRLIPTWDIIIIMVFSVILTSTRAQSAEKHFFFLQCWKQSLIYRASGLLACFLFDLLPELHTHLKGQTQAESMMNLRWKLRFSPFSKVLMLPSTLTSHKCLTIKTLITSWNVWHINDWQ